MGAKWAGKFRRVPSLSYLYGSVAGDEPESNRPAKMAKIKTKPAKRTTSRKGFSTRVVSTRRKKVSVSNEGEEEEQGGNSIGKK